MIVVAGHPTVVDISLGSPGHDVQARPRTGRCPIARASSAIRLTVAHPTATVGGVELERWSLEQVLAVAPSPGSVAVAEAFTEASRWSATGADDRVVWGRCQGSSHEPYDTAVDHIGVGWRCSCPSRVRPCKHALALLLRWVRGEITAGQAPPAVASWIARRPPSSPPMPSEGSRAGSPDRADVDGRADSTGARDAADSTGASDAADAAADAVDATGDPASDPHPSRPPRPDPSSARNDRVTRMRTGLLELQRWLEDRMRTGLNDPALARYATWDDLAARLVDAQIGGLANRVRRLAGLVGAGVDWHERVLAELGTLFLIVQGGLRITELPDGRSGEGFDRRVDPDGPVGDGRSSSATVLGDLAGAVALAAGWQIRQAEVLAGVPETDDWIVAGRSDTREDRIEVRRIWLWGRTTRRWAMLLSFAAYGQGLDETLQVGEVHRGDLFRYPGSGLRALLRPATDDAHPVSPDRVEVRSAVPEPLGIAAACRVVGDSIAVEPWLERLAVTVLAAPTVAEGRWVLTDPTGSLPIIGEDSALATLVAASLGRAVPITVEWTPAGLLPLTIHRPDRAIDVGTRADPSFVGVGR